MNIWPIKVLIGLSRARVIFSFVLNQNHFTNWALKMTRTCNAYFCPMKSGLKRKMFNTIVLTVDPVLQFFQEADSDLSNKLREHKNNIAFLTDLFTKFNQVNLQL